MSLSGPEVCGLGTERGSVGAPTTTPTPQDHAHDPSSGRLPSPPTGPPSPDGSVLDPLFREELRSSLNLSLGPKGVRWATRRDMTQNDFWPLNSEGRDLRGGVGWGARHETEHPQVRDPGVILFSHDLILLTRHSWRRVWTTQGAEGKRIITRDLTLPWSPRESL